MLATFFPRILSVTEDDFGPKRVGVTGDWKRLRNEQFHDLYSSPNVIFDQVKEDAICQACGIYEGAEKCTQTFGWET